MLSADLILKFFVFLCIFVSLVTGAQSQNFASAKIVKIQGAVQIARVDSNAKMMVFVELGENAPVLAGDVIKTKTGARVVLGLADGSQAIIGENTTVEIKDLSESPRTIFNVLRGKTRIKIEKMGGKPNPYRVTTPTTVIAVRGTVFDVFVKDNRTEVFVNEGAVSVTGLLAPEQEVLLAPGQFTRVEAGAAPRRAEQFRRERNEEFFRAIAQNDDRRRDDNDRAENSRGGRDARRGNDERARRRADDFPNSPDARPNPAPIDSSRAPDRESRPRRPQFED